MVTNYETYFDQWKNWERFEPRFDGTNGVYAFRLNREFGRLRGTSAILYIGKVEQNSAQNRSPGLWHRLMNYKQRNSGASERLKDVERHFEGASEIEYAYRECEHPREEECALLDDYYQKHLELPPLNRAG